MHNLPLMVNKPSIILENLMYIAIGKKGHIFELMNTSFEPLPYLIVGNLYTFSCYLFLLTNQI